MTKRDVLQSVRGLGLSASYSAFTREFRISFPGPGSEPSAYYTEDPDDALGTAEYMAESQRAMLA